MIGVVFLDLKRAFEVVDRSILIRKLQRYGLRAVVLEWFRCYLEKRSQRVKFNGVLSEPIDVNFEVPQGLVLGLLLFLLYINDITEAMTADCSIKLFADDELIYATGSTRQEINDKLNEQMIRVDDWLSRNKLYLNVSKTKVMLIRRVRRKVAENNFKVKFRGGDLKVVSKIKYLGVMIDRNVNFTEHDGYIGRKVGAKLGILRRIGKDMTRIRAPTGKYRNPRSGSSCVLRYCNGNTEAVQGLFGVQRSIASTTWLTQGSMRQSNSYPSNMSGHQ